MFTPEFVNENQGEFVLVANHSLENPESVQISIQYNKARIAFGEKNLPPHIKRCRLIYDIRGQTIQEITINTVRQALEGICAVEFKQ